MPNISIPTVSSPLAPDMRAFVQRVREALSMVAAGVVTVDQLKAASIIAVTPGGQIVPGAGVGGAPVLDYTPPPTPTGLSATGALATIILSWNDPVLPYTNNHAHTEVWRATTNVFSSAVRIGTTDASLYADAVGMTGVTYYYWIRFVSKADVAGPYTTVVSAQTGKVGNSNLAPLIVQADNLAVGAVTADKVMLDLGGDNLLGNNSFEVDDNADGTADGWGLYNNSNVSEPATLSLVAGRVSGKAQRVTWTGSNTTTKGVFAAFSLLRGGAWQPGKTYVVSWYARADTVKTFGMGLYWNIAPASQQAIKNPNLTASYQRYAIRITWGGTVETANALFCSIASGMAATGYVEFDDFQIEEGDTLTGYFGKLATGTIVAGDGAISNLAITNALIANLAVDTAKMADLAVVEAKIANGAVTNLKIGNIIQSNNYVPGSSGWIINKDGTVEFNSALFRGGVWAGDITSSANVTISGAGHIKGGATGYEAGTGFWMGYHAGTYKVFFGTQIGARMTWDGANFTIYDATGQVVLSSGSGVPWPKVINRPTSISGINTTEYNHLVSIQYGADVTGTHMAASIANQGAFATLNQITPSNVWTYVANAAIGNAQIGGDIWSSTWNGAQGWYLQRGGNLYCANAYVRGDVQATSLNAGSANIVNTLHIAGNAVTVPVVAETSADIWVDSQSWVTVQTAYIDVGWNPVIAMFGFEATQSAYIDGLDVYYRLVGPDGKVILGSSRVIPYASNRAARRQLVNSLFGFVVAPAMYISNYTGPAGTYSLQILATQTTVFNCKIFLFGAKK